MNANSRSEFSRREALQALAAGALVAGLAVPARRALAALADAPRKGAPAAPADEAPITAWQLPKLPYGFDALEPHIDRQTMELHYTKHHQAYLTNARRLLEPHRDLITRSPEHLLRNLAQLPEDLRTGVRNQVGGHANHSFFWTILGPNAGGPSANTLGEAIGQQFGSFDNFQQRFAEAALKVFGSGWTWLVAEAGRLRIMTTANQDSPLSQGATPLVGLDVWEHAYYLHYINAFWNVVNWSQADIYYQGTLTAG